MHKFRSCLVIQLITLLFSLRAYGAGLSWDQTERKRIQSMSLSQLPQSPQESTQNSWVGRKEAERLGSRLFSDAHLSKSGDVACSSCHEPEKEFASDRIVVSKLHGPRSVPSLLAIGWSSFFFWDGRKDSLWSQAIEPLLNPEEHNFTAQELRLRLLETYALDLQLAFGSAAVDKIKNDLSGSTALIAFGKAISSYLTSLTLKPSPFDVFAEKLGKGELNSSSLTECAQLGLKVFLGKGMCINCHNGPLLSNGDFHNTGVPMSHALDNPSGRAQAISLLQADRFACKSALDNFDPRTPNCQHVTHMQSRGMRLIGAFKTPSLRGLAKTAPYMHNGHFKTLAEVIQHYRQANDGPIGMTELLPLSLNDHEASELECFLNSL